MKKTVKKKAAPKKTKVVARPKKVVAKPKKVVAAKKVATKRKPQAKAKPPPPPPEALLERGVHPRLTWLLANLPFGRHAGGLLQFTAPGSHARELEPWLMGRTDGRT